MNPKNLLFASSILSVMSALGLTELIRRNAELQAVQNNNLFLMLLLCFALLIAVAWSFVLSTMLPPDKEKKEKPKNDDFLKKL